MPEQRTQQPEVASVAVLGGQKGPVTNEITRLDVSTTMQPQENKTATTLTTYRAANAPSRHARFVLRGPQKAHKQNSDRDIPTSHINPVYNEA